MNVLLLRIAGPMQSWGIQSRFTVRDTGLEPSKSGVIGLICAALGRPRTQPINNLADLRMGVRVDFEGSMERDFQTAGGIHHRGDNYGVPTADGKIKKTVTSTRYYLADADFLVGLEGEDLQLLKQIDAALGNPRWPLFLGRKAFPPGEPVRLRDGLRQDEGLYDALRTYPRQPRADDKKPEKLRLILEDAAGETVRVDQPLSFSERRFAPRHVRTDFIPLSEIPLQKEESCISPS